jgi:hypothetical protein
VYDTIEYQLCTTNKKLTKLIPYIIPFYNRASNKLKALQDFIPTLNDTDIIRSCLNISEFKEELDHIDSMALTEGLHSDELQINIVDIFVHILKRIYKIHKEHSRGWKYDPDELELN